MALRWLEGFDGISTTTAVASEAEVKLWQSNFYPHGTGDGQAHAGRLGGGAFSFGDNANADNEWFDISIPNTATVIVGFAVKPGFYNSQASSDILQFWDKEFNGASVEQFDLRQSLGGSTLYVTRNSTVVGDIAFGVIPMDRWSYIEIKLLIDDTVGTVEVRVNGKAVISETNVDTKNSSGAAQCNMVRFRGVDGAGAAENQQWLLDDIYVCDNTGSVNNDFLGPIKVETIFPSAAGDDTDFTPSAGSNWENVDDASHWDGDTTYNEAGTTGNLDLHNCEDLTVITGSGTIHGLRLDTYCRVTSAAVKTVIPTVKSGVTEGAVSGVGIAAENLFVGVPAIFEQDPAAAGAWTTTTINSMQIGYEVG